MAVTVDAVGTATAASVQTSPVTNNGLTIGATANALLVLIANANKTPGTETATWGAGAQSLSIIGSVNTSSAAVGRVEIWGLLNPSTGSGAITYSWSGAGAPTITLAGVSFIGTDTSSLANAFKNLGTAQTTSASTANQNVTIISSVGSIVAGVACSTNARVSGYTGTVIYEADVQVQINSGAQYASGSAPSVTLGFTPSFSGSSQWAIAGVSVTSAAVEVPTGFIGRFASGQHFINRVLFQNTPSEIILPAIPNSDNQGQRQPSCRRPDWETRWISL